VVNALGHESRLDHKARQDDFVERREISLIQNVMESAPFASS